MPMTRTSVFMTIQFEKVAGKPGYDLMGQTKRQVDRTGLA